MKKAGLLVLVSMVLSIGLMSQSFTRQYMGISAGASFPLNDFGSTDLSNINSGFARIGVNININYAYRLTHVLGITGIASFTTHGIDRDALNSEGQKNNPDYNFSVIADTWSVGALMGGPYLRIPFTERFSWDTRALIGVYGAYSPEYEIHGTNTTNNEKIRYFKQKSRSYALALDLGTGFKYRFGSKYVLLNADYTYSHAKFNDSWVEDFQGNEYTEGIEQTISMFIVTVGLGYAL